MRPRRTHESTNVFRLTGGNEDNDLWVTRTTDGGEPVLISVWEPTEAERLRIAAGENIELTTWGQGTPPIAMAVTDVPLGRKPDEG